MRFLFVYQDYATQARKLLDELDVRDVELVIARKNAISPTEPELARLRTHSGADAAACEINRIYRKSAAAFVTFCCTPKKFRFEDRQLRDWLVPPGQGPLIHAAPSDAFRTAASGCPRLLLHPDALKAADELAAHRRAFANLAATLLARWASGESLGPPREWKSTHGVDFAPNGRVAFKYAGTCGSDAREGRTEWHLKEGDNTTRASAARVYFARVEFPSGTQVVVFYVGPHPEDGERSVTFSAP